MNLITAGRSLLLRTLADTKPHLWFILTDPADTPETVVGVMLRTQKTYTDPTVVLNVGDHDFVKHPSSVHYSTARWFRVEAMSRALSNGTAHLLDDMSAGLLKRVRKGLIDSPYTVNEIKEYCRSRFPS